MSTNTMWCYFGAFQCKPICTKEFGYLSNGIYPANPICKDCYEGYRKSSIVSNDKRKWFIITKPSPG